MKTKLISAAVTIGVLLGSTVAQAVTFTDVIRRQNGAELTFEGKTDSNKKLMLKVYNKLYGEADKNGFVKLTTVSADEEGNIKFSLTIPENLSDGTASTGDYEIICSDGTSKGTYPFKYMNTVDSDSVYTKLSTYASSDLINELKQQFLQDVEMVGADVLVYGKLNDAKSEKAKALDWFVQNRSGSLQDMVKLLNDCIYTVYLDNCPESESLNIVKKLNPTFGTVEFSSLASEQQTEISGYMLSQSYNNLSDSSKNFGKGLAISKLSSASRSEVVGILQTYANILGLDTNAKYISYSNKSLTDKEKVGEKFVLAVGAIGKINSTEQAVSLFEQAYDAININTNPPVNGNGGGGGGGASSGGGLPSGGAAGSTRIPVTDESVGVEKTEFSDVSVSHWASQEISLFVKKKIISGYADGSFMPDKSVTREEFVKLLVNAAGLYESGLTADFNDVNKDAWYAPYIACAKKSGLVNGVSDADFGVGRTLTREDMAVIMHRAAQSDGKMLSKIRDYAEFTDELNIADYAKEAVKVLYEARLINGMDNGSFASKSPLTRAQAVKVLYDMYYGG